MKGMKDVSALMPQMRLFLNFLDSMLEEQNFKMNLLTLEIYGCLAEKMRTRAKPHLRSDYFLSQYRYLGDKTFLECSFTL